MTFEMSMEVKIPGTQENTEAVLDYVVRNVRMVDLFMALPTGDRETLRGLLNEWHTNTAQPFNLGSREALALMLQGKTVESENCQYRIGDSGLQKLSKRDPRLGWEDVKYDFIGKLPSSRSSYREVRA